MPRVPTYEIGQVRNQGINARQSISAPADAFGSNVAQSITQLGTQISRAGDVASEIAIKQQQDFDETVLRESDTALSSFIRDKIDDPQSGFLNLRGKDALNARDQLNQEIDEYEKSIREKLDPRIANDWGRISQQRLQNARSRIASHSRDQFFTWEDESFLARQLNQQSEAASHVGNQSEINKSIAVGVIDIENQAEKRGWSGDVLERKKLDFVTGAHTQVINRLIAQGKPSEADLYYRSNQDKIDPAKRDEIENALRTNTNKAKAQRATDEIMANPELDAAGQLAAARQIEDANVRAEVETMVTQRQAERVRLKTQSENDAEDEVMKQIANGTRYADLDPNLLNQLGSSGRTRVSAYLRAKADAALKPGDPVAGKRVFYSLREMARNDYSTFKRVWNPQLYLGIMEEGDIDSLTKIAESAVSAKSAVSTDKMIEMGLGSIGLNYDDRANDDSDGNRIRAFITNIDNKIRGHVDKHGKEPDSLQINKWVLEEVQNNLVNIDIPGPVNSTQPMATVEQDDYADVYVTVEGQDVYLREIPDTARAAILSNLQRRGMPTTEYNIALYWKRSQAYLNAKQAGTPTADDIGTNDVPTAGQMGLPTETPALDPEVTQ